jgi:hypothetical protein
MTEPIHSGQNATDDDALRALSRQLRTISAKLRAMNATWAANHVEDARECIKLRMTGEARDADYREAAAAAKEEK